LWDPECQAIAYLLLLETILQSPAEL